MTITAKFPGTCATCNQPIKPGQRIEWTKTERGKASHTRCVAKAEPTINKPKVFAPTSEQMNALAMFGTGKNMAIEAGAGTGKTSTLILLAESTTRRGQYIAFNKALRFDQPVATPSGWVRISDLQIGDLVIGSDGAPHRVTKVIDRGIRPMNRVLFSDGVEVIADDEHLWEIERTHKGNTTYAIRSVTVSDRIYDGLVWTLEVDRDHTYVADGLVTHNCQDANPILLAIVEAQTHAQRVYVGDSQQAIYGFTGATNALDRIRECDGETAFLTQSFRFGPAIAEQANGILDRIEGAALRLVGTDSIASVVGAVAEPDAILCRTNAAAVRNVIRLQTENKVAALVGGGDEVVRFAKAAKELEVAGSTEHPDLACFANWAAVVEYVEQDEQGGELRLMVKLVDDFGADAILAALGRSVREVDADVIISTAHKSKGREWASVQLAGDFLPVEKMNTDELRLLYVACTRAKRNLDITAIDFAKQKEEKHGRELVA